MTDIERSRFTQEQIIGFIKQAEAGLPIKELCRKGGFSDATFYKWRAKYGGMDVRCLVNTGHSRLRLPSSIWMFMQTLLAIGSQGVSVATGGCKTPQPQAHALYADKRSLAVLCDAELLGALGASPEASIPTPFAIPSAHGRPQVPPCELSPSSANIPNQGQLAGRAILHVVGNVATSAGSFLSVFQPKPVPS